VTVNFDGTTNGRVFLTGLAIVPEPTTFVLAFLGLLGMAWFGWRKRK